ncbi:MAG: hypothetical protein EOP56_16505 [Sphingobacteriales bacterium]|nr:MAG: hypothetical protein EOP56_16505 [Sphingobacteriales bacterium]
MRRVGLLLAFLISLSACRKRPDPVAVPVDTTKPGNTVDSTKADTLRTLKMSFDAVVGKKPLVFGSEAYRNANGDSFTVSKYRYYISNVKLTATDGKVYAEPESYHLIDHKTAGAAAFTMSGVPDRNYTRITFMIGVDSLRNVSGAQTGALDPINGMFWDWNTGYIMAAMEGNVKDGTANGKPMALHIGGFDQANSVLKWVTLDLQKPVTAGKDKKPVIYITSDVQEWFSTPNPIDIKKTPLVMKVGMSAQAIAENYADMFKVDHIE